jgi:hypothetical protein
MVFDRPAAKLPIARLRPSAPRARRRAIVADLDRWLLARWEWLRPRTVPLLAAFLGLLVTLAAVKYVVVYAYSDDFALEIRTRMMAKRPAMDPAEHAARHTRCYGKPRRPSPVPVQIVVEPIAPGDSYIELTFEPPAP